MKWWVGNNSRTTLIWETPKTVGPGPPRDLNDTFMRKPSNQTEGEGGVRVGAGRKAWLTTSWDDGWCGRGRRSRLTHGLDIIHVNRFVWRLFPVHRLNASFKL